MNPCVRFHSGSLQPTKLRYLSRKAWKLSKAEPGPHSPRRVIYAMLPTSLTPVALQYTTRARGSSFWISRTLVATWNRPQAKVLCVPSQRCLHSWCGTNARDNGNTLPLAGKADILGLTHTRLCVNSFVISHCQKQGAHSKSTLSYLLYSMVRQSTSHGAEETGVHAVQPSSSPLNVSANKVSCHKLPMHPVHEPTLVDCASLPGTKFLAL